MGKFIDITGKRFGRLVAIKQSGYTSSGNAKWDCVCDCGKETTVASGDLRKNKNNTMSCGCMAKELSSKRKSSIDMTGKRFGKLVVIGLDDRKRGDRKRYWLCQCDCGKNTSIITSSLTRGNNTKSCGCLVGKYKKSAKERGLDFLLNIEQIRILTSSNCYYCGCVPKKEIKTRGNNGNYFYNGIDRIDSSKGYSIENVVPCCYKCNVAKSNYTREDFLSWISKVYYHSILEKECKNVSKLPSPQLL